MSLANFTGLLWGEEVEVTHIPPDWILGVYDSKSGTSDEDLKDEDWVW